MKTTQFMAQVHCANSFYGSNSITYKLINIYLNVTLNENSV